MRGRQGLTYIIFIIIFIAAFIGCLLVGTVEIPAVDVFSSLWGGEVAKNTWRVIVLETRLPAACTACVAGAALSVAGLLLQTTFDNPLAGPSILGISTGASLGVAIVMLAMGGVASLWGQAAVLVSAIGGAMAVIAILLVLSAVLRSSVMLLIAGILIGYLSSSAISLLNFFAISDSVQAYVVWGLGTFNNVTLGELPAFAVLGLGFIVLSFLFVKPLNAMLIGESYAISSGVNIKGARTAILLVSGGLIAVTTSWCGPIGFLGLVVPHICRLLLRTADHRRLLPACVLVGAATGVACQFLSVMPGQGGIIPINAITPVVGVPVIIYIILRRRSIFYFN